MASPPKSRSRSQGPLARWMSRLVKILGFGAIAGLVALAIAVAIAYASLPSFQELQSSPNGQMIRVHAADGTVIVSLGPSYGDWLTYDRLPQTMVDAMVSVEDRRFYMHP